LSRSHLTVVCPILNLEEATLSILSKTRFNSRSRCRLDTQTSVSSNSLSFLLSPVVNMEDLRAVKWHVSDSLTRIDDEEV
ncbi:hypothetical protein KCU99_g238, partial [Aureobasidium melanogenum]